MRQRFQFWRDIIAAVCMLASFGAWASDFASPSANKISAQALGVFTKNAQYLVCMVEGGVWEARDGDHGEPFCHTPYIGVSDANIHERSVFAVNQSSCTQSRVHFDSGWTTGWIPIPPELHEYSEFQKGYISESVVQEVRQIVVEYNVKVNRNGEWVCDPETPFYRYFGFSRASDRRQDFEGCYKRGDPVDVRTGETVANRDLSAELGFPLALTYGAMSLDAGNSGIGGAWRHSYSTVFRYSPASAEHGTPETALVNIGTGDLLIFLRALDGRWESKSLRREVLVDILDKKGAISGWRLQRGDAFLIFDRDGLLSRIEESSGRRRIVAHYYPDLPSYSKVQQALIKNVDDDFGRRLVFDYDVDLYLKSVSSGGRSVEALVDPVRRKLSGLSVGQKTIAGYHYDDVRFPDALTGIDDEDQQLFVSYSYRDGGQATGSAHANGADNWTFDYSSGGAYKQTATEKDPLGAVRSWEFSRDYLGNGVYSRWRSPLISQPPGSGCEAASQSVTHDNFANVLSRVDFAEHRSCHAHAADRNVETYRVEGLNKADACPVDLAAYQVPTGLPAERQQRKVSTQWHSIWKLVARRAEPKHVTTTVYNGEADPLNNNAIATCAAGDPRLSDTSRIAVVCRRYEQSTDDETGNLGFTAPAKETRIWNYTYNQNGQVLSESDPRTGKLTTYEYWPDTSFTGDRGHWLGDLKTVKNALGQTTNHLEYNKRGQLLTTQRPNGSTELREYHLRGWLTKLTLVPASGGVGQVTQYDYYDTGLLKKVTQPDGSYASYKWDDAHRLTDVTDSVGNKVHYELDNAGNRTAEQFKDPDGHLAKTIDRTFDALGRLSSSTGRQ